MQERKGTGASAGSWWWFAVTGDPQSYAPFQATKSDTRASVQERVVQFYTSRLFQLSQPTQRGAHWARRNVPTPAVAVPAVTPVTEATA